MFRTTYEKLLKFKFYCSVRKMDFIPPHSFGVYKCKKTVIVLDFARRRQFYLNKFQENSIKHSFSIIQITNYKNHGLGIIVEYKGADIPT